MPESFSSTRINVRGVRFDAVTKEQALNAAVSLIESDGFSYMVTPNSEIVQACVENPSLYNAVNGASLIIPDGIGVIYASRILGTPLPERVPGCEIGEGVVGYAASTGTKIYFLGGGKETSERDAVYKLAGEALKEKYPGFSYAGHDGYFADEEIDDILADIDESGAKILFVCLGAPKQEKWMYTYGKKLKNVTFAAGLGGTLDIFAGVAERAPEFYLKNDLEWLYRLKKNPDRIGRMLKLPKFLISTVVHGNRGSESEHDA